MAGITMVIALLGGVSLFLFGMSLMGDGLKRVAGNKLELVLYKLTSSPLKGVLLGSVVTAIIQSSSATTVMVVGFVNSGMMKVAQAIGIIMGANIGTSITGWILCLPYIGGSSSGLAQLLSTATIAAVVAIIGIVFKMILKKAAYKNIADIMFGFSVLMMGMRMMSEAVSPLKDNPYFTGALTMFSNPFMGILLGIAFTAILQSASASVGILQTLAYSTGSITFASAFPIILGIGVGAACPVLLSSIGTNKNGKRTAFVYLLNDTLGMVIWGSIFYLVNAFVKFDFLNNIMSPVGIALLNTVYRMLTVMVLLPFTELIEKLVFKLFKDTAEDLEEQADFDLLEERFLEYPPLALEQSHLAMNGMAKKARKNILRAIGMLYEYSAEKYQKVQEKENLIDKYEDKLGTYLMQATSRELSPDQTRQASKMLHTISDFERLGDHAVNISKVANEIYDKKIVFSDEAEYELGVLIDAVKEIVDITVESFIEDDVQKAVAVEPLREVITLLCNEMKLRHVTRLSNGKCKLEQGFAFNDLLTNTERIGAHCSNVAVAMIELEASGFDTHEYLKSIRELKDANYCELLSAYEEKYDINGFRKKKKSKKENQ